ncbi:MAG: Rrf2 family transcriptional regulator [Verrucomicrobia bacterium]|nr:Rrf2 family transcriptional regulator [Verrucomicrobiota bacterium]
MTTKRGYRGGIGLVRPAGAISVLEIVVAVEGEEWMSRCLLGLDNCGEPSSCPTHKFWQRIRREVSEELCRTTLAAVIASRWAGGFRTESSCGARGRPPANVPNPSLRENPNPELRL